MTNRKIKYLIIGAGPAGLQMAYFLKKAGLDYLVLEKNQCPASFYEKFPVHRKLISINKKYNYFTEDEFNLRHDWNSLLSDNPKLRFTNYSEELFPSADIVLNYFKDFAKDNKLKIDYNSCVTKIAKDASGNFKITLKDKSTIDCSVLLLGTGARKQHMPSEIEGIEHTTPYGESSLNLELYKNKRVAILGGGNSAFETADFLSGVAANVHVFLKEEPKMAWDSHFVGDIRAVNNNIFDLYQLKSLHAVLKPRIRKITKLKNGCLQTQHEYDYPESNVRGTLKLTREYDYIINCTGFKYTQLALFDNITPQTVNDDKFYDLKEDWESKNVSNLYIIGTSMQAIDKKSSSGFIHGFRYNIRTLSNLLLKKYENIPYPSESIAFSPFEEFLKQLYSRFSISDSIFQLYGFLGDKLELSLEEGKINWEKDLPLNLIKKTVKREVPTLTLSLEFGFDKHPNKSSLEFLGPSDPHDTENSAFLHPVIRYHFKGKQDEFHFGDSLLGRWDLPHASGGAIASYHTEFYNWLANILGLEKKSLKDIGENPNFEKWD